jgi:hypothetical protein|tara:strand:+ start:41 stop:337 length:297 start_codon:yes stop_codon:yes gene_type:complete
VIVADVKDMSEKSHMAVVPEVVGVTLVKLPPPDEYVPESETSLEVVKAVVEASKEAELVYNAILKVSPEEAVKLCVPTSSSCLKLVQTACDIAMFILL